VTFGPALFALAGAALCSIGVDAAFDEAAFWERVKVRAYVGAASTDARVIGCRHCGLVARSHEGERCARCERTLRRRKPDSVQRTWALVGAAALLAIPANVLPVMTIVKLGRGGPSTILGGTVELAQAGLWGLAAIVFVASILVPLVKLTGLSVLLVTTQRSSAARLPLRTRLFRLIALIGRWSMVDVFATMMLVTLARFGWLGRVLPDAGASAFCAVVVLTMFASESFDPRLMWDAAGRNQQPLALADEVA
jgi:paraquat-inducible protein A